MDPDLSKPVRLSLEKQAFERRQRPALYEVVNGLVNLTADIQKTLNLRPEPCQIYLIIAVSVVQRYARGPGSDIHDSIEPLPDKIASSISRRRIADITGIPRETVARHVRDLIERGLVAETGKGKLATPPGLLRNIGPTGLPDRLVGEVAAVAQKLIKLGVLRMEA